MLIEPFLNILADWFILMMLSKLQVPRDSRISGGMSNYLSIKDQNEAARMSGGASVLC